MKALEIFNVALISAIFAAFAAEMAHYAVNHQDYTSQGIAYSLMSLFWAAKMFADDVRQFKEEKPENPVWLTVTFLVPTYSFLIASIAANPSRLASFLMIFGAFCCMSLWTIVSIGLRWCRKRRKKSKFKAEDRKRILWLLFNMSSLLTLILTYELKINGSFVFLALFSIFLFDIFVTGRFFKSTNVADDRARFYLGQSTTVQSVKSVPIPQSVMDKFQDGGEYEFLTDISSIEFKEGDIVIRRARP